MLKPPVPGRLDHDLYPQRRSFVEQAAPWPGGKPAAAFVLLRLQSLELDPPPEAKRDMRWRSEFGNFMPDYRAHSMMAYGNRIGIFRLLDLLQPLGWQVAVSVNGLVAQEHPALVRSLRERGVDIVAGGWSASRMVDQALPVATEAAWLARTLDAIEGACGQRPTVYASQDYGYSLQTAELLVAQGLTTAVDWPNDDTPFAFGRDGRIVMIPTAAEMEDTQMVAGRKLTPPVWADHLLEGLTYLAQHAKPGTVLALPLHAWISGAAHRFANLRRSLDAFDARAFWQAGPQDIASHWRAANPR